MDESLRRRVLSPNIGHLADRCGTLEALVGRVRAGVDFTALVRGVDLHMEARRDAEKLQADLAVVAVGLRSPDGSITVGELRARVAVLIKVLEEPIPTSEPAAPGEAAPAAAEEPATPAPDEVVPAAPVPSALIPDEIVEPEATIDRPASGLPSALIKIPPHIQRVPISQAFLYGRDASGQIEGIVTGSFLAITRLDVTAEMYAGSEFDSICDRLGYHPEIMKLRTSIAQCCYPSGTRLSLTFSYCASKGYAGQCIVIPRMGDNTPPILPNNLLFSPDMFPEIFQRDQVSINCIGGKIKIAVNVPMEPVERSAEHEPVAG